MKILLVILIALSIISCASRPPYVASPQVNTAIKEQVINLPALNTQTEITVGDSLYAEVIQVQSQEEIVTLNSSGSASLDNGYTVKVNEGQTGKLYTLKNVYPAYCDNVVAKSSAIDVLGGSSNACIVDFDNDGNFEKAMFSKYDRYFPLSPKIQYSKMPTEVKTSLKTEKFRREAIFQGVSGNAVKVLFREFNDNLIRAAFTQNITYDLDKNGKTVIAFKGFKAQVHKANGTTLSYSVLSPFAKE